MRQAQRGEFPHPRHIDSSIDKALEAVCLKAMATKPEDRYASCRALADDVERWMADEPVMARCEPTIEQARRWVRRNRTAVIAVGAALVAALAGLGAVAAVEARANHDLRDANARTLRERDQARQNFDLARRAVDEYLTRVGQNPLLKEQGLHELRQELLGAALGYYRDFLRQRGDDPELKVDGARAYERVGDILIELGRYGEALAAYDQALALIEPLVRHQPGDPTTATARLRLQAARLQALCDGGWASEALAAFEGARVLGEALLAAGDSTEDLPEILARVYLNATLALRDTGRDDEALWASLRAQGLAEKATDDHPSDFQAALTRLLASINASNRLLAFGRVDEARRLCEQGIAFGEARVAEHPRDVEMRLHLVTLQSTLGKIEKNKGRLLEALEHYRTATDTLGDLARGNPLLIRAVELGQSARGPQPVTDRPRPVRRGGAIRPGRDRRGRGTRPGCSLECLFPGLGGYGIHVPRQGAPQGGITPRGPCGITEVSGDDGDIRQRRCLLQSGLHPRAGQHDFRPG